MERLEDEVKNLIKESCVAKDFDGKEELSIFTEHFRKRFGSSLKAVVAYGSQAKDSWRDFFLITDNYMEFHKHNRDAYERLRLSTPWIHSMLNRVLPPSIYYFACEDKKCGLMESKYNVVSLNYLGKSTSKLKRDWYMVGRFQKIMNVLYYADDNTLDAIVDGIHNSMKMGIPLAIDLLSLKDKITHERLSKVMLCLSYAIEKRIEKPLSEKIPKLYLDGKRGEKNYYDLIYPMFLDDERFHFLVKDENVFSDTRSQEDKRLAGELARKELRRHRNRYKSRMFKAILTNTHWFRYVVKKGERSFGQHIDESDENHPFWSLAKFIWRCKIFGKYGYLERYKVKDEIETFLKEL